MRSKRAKRRPLIADPIYKSKVVNRMIKIVMLDGKKSTAEKIVYGVLAKLSDDRKEAVRIFEEAVKNVMPTKEVRSRRIGGATYQVPYPLKFDRSEALALRWIVRGARGKEGTDMITRLHREIADAYEGQGDSVKKREETHKTAESNRAFAHFARF
ncbi:30S ribosomal protein S7 [Patescibacteria group bacterium]